MCILWLLATLACFFRSFNKIISLKQILLFLFITMACIARAQKIDSIFVNLYTDSLKIGTYNYINIDGKLADGSYLPLDSTNIIFWSSDGKFFGNSLWIKPGFKKQKVTIKAILRSDTSVCKQFDMYIQKKPDPPLKTLEEILNGMKANKEKKHS